MFINFYFSKSFSCPEHNLDGEQMETQLTSGYPQLSSSLGVGMLCVYPYCWAVKSAKEVFAHAILFSDLCSSNFLWG